MRLSILIVLLLSFNGIAQQRWQQAVDYKMEVSLDVKTHKLNGTQKLLYTNNSPDTLHKVFYHLYFNAFQPNSMMDTRSRELEDPDFRVRDRILHLSSEEIGYQQIQSLRQDGQAVQYQVEGTILEVTLAKPILPNSKTLLEMRFEAQVPIQIRRSGRHNSEGVEYSMSQWYPKISEYDYQGWHANPYIAREFHGVWGDFDIKITLDADYVIGATGYLQNPQEIGHGYQDPNKKFKKPKGKTLTWHFVAPKVHDFVWAADPDFVHETYYMPEQDLTLHFFHQHKDKNSDYAQNWKKLQKYTADAFIYMNEHFGEYPYKQYSVIQGGDGGMEYPMATLITGNRKLGSLVGVTVHELIHSWYQGVIATNESLYAWMDEGFNSYAGNLAMQKLFNTKGDPHRGTYNAYFSVVKSGREEALSTHADHFNTNRAYGMAAYAKGAIFVNQLNYIIGKENTAKGMKRYYEEWQFRHPNDNDFIRIMEKVSGLELDWYREYWVYTTHTIDYGIKSVKPNRQNTQVTLERRGRMPMPVDLLVTYQDGRKELYYIPLKVMRGEKPHEYEGIKRTVANDWGWVYPEYQLQIPVPMEQIKRIEIDPEGYTADMHRENNLYQQQEED